MPKQKIVISGFLGMNRSLQPTQLNPSEDGDARMYALVNVDPSELRQLVPRPQFLFLDHKNTPDTTWPRRFA